MVRDARAQMDRLSLRLYGASELLAPSSFVDVRYALAFCMHLHDRYGVLVFVLYTHVSAVRVQCIHRRCVRRTRSTHRLRMSEKDEAERLMSARAEFMLDAASCCIPPACFPVPSLLTHNLCRPA